jgi:hypothetical protein
LVAIFFEGPLKLDEAVGRRMFANEEVRLYEGLPEWRGSFWVNEVKFRDDLSVDVQYEGILREVILKDLFVCIRLFGQQPFQTLNRLFKSVQPVPEDRFKWNRVAITKRDRAALCPNACNGVRQIATNIELYARPYRPLVPCRGIDVPEKFDVVKEEENGTDASRDRAQADPLPDRRSCLVGAIDV